MVGVGIGRSSLRCVPIPWTRAVRTSVMFARMLVQRGKAPAPHVPGARERMYFQSRAYAGKIVGGALRYSFQPFGGAAPPLISRVL
jgi:hypothetical protein